MRVLDKFFNYLKNEVGSGQHGDHCLERETSFLVRSKTWRRDPYNKYKESYLGRM